MDSKENLPEENNTSVPEHKTFGPLPTIPKPTSESISSTANKITTPIKQALPSINPGNSIPKLKQQSKLKKLTGKLKSKWLGWSKLQKGIAIFVALLVVGAIAFGSYLALHKSPKVAAPVVKKVAVVKPTTIASPLTGNQVTPAQAARPVTGIMIENSTDARPQSGLQEAGAVFEAVAEGGITRFLALFQEASPQYIGPVRSLRPYYIDFAQAFQASIAHVGGSPEALSRVRSSGYRDLDQFFNSTYYTRVTSRDAPHNVYTTFVNLDALNSSKGYTSSTYTPWARKADTVITVPTAKTINLAISSFYFNVSYTYDATTNTYLRSEGGVAHTDLVSATDKTGVQLHSKVVIGLVMPYSIDADGQHSDYADTGTGNAYVFQDGGVTIGKWTKAAATDQITFTDTAGASLKLDAGQVWLSLVGSDSAVTYAP